MFDIGRGGIVRDSRDVLEQKQADDAIARMPTLLGGEIGLGAVIVRWADVGGENAVIFVEDFFLGRGSDCGVRFYDPLVSRKHARVYHDAEAGWRIEDLGSRNGTIVDGRRVEGTSLSPESDVQLNEAGPILRLELVSSGGDVQRALASFPPGQAVAHVRAQSIDLDRTCDAGK
ncbi:MAG: hypothetical protein CL908_07285 [Deltaproteobacteria bacterium]|nr:hypothetical protein [Deltaproteobacteria bacterium]